MMLKEYKRKRDFTITPEPSGSGLPKTRTKKTKALTFVIQKHAATRLHYDFRLEVDGVMVSWAVPKGPSSNPTDKRLAVMTEDHPIEYSSFEGIIPDKQYGAGEVIIWDEGTYSPDEKQSYSWEDRDEANKRMREGLKKGKLSFYLKGKKLEGSWTLVRLRGKEKDWLLIKHRDKFVDEKSDITDEDASVVSGKTLEDLQNEGADRIWTAKGAKKADPETTGKSTKKGKLSAPERVAVTSSSDTEKKKAPGKLSAEAKSVIEQLDNEKEKLTLEVGNLTVPVTSLNKVFWPEHNGAPAITKRDYLVYLAKISSYVIPHLTDRLLTLVRFPNGIHESRFYQKHWEQKLPQFVKAVPVFTEKEDQDLDFLVCNNIQTLLWLGQIADLELHTSHTRITAKPDALDLPEEMTGSVEQLEASIANYPDFLVLDLDPYLYSGKEKKGAEPELHDVGFRKCCEVALWLKKHLDDLRLKTFIKTSGKTGLHIFIPIERNIDYDTVRTVSEILCRQVLKEHPREVTMDWAVIKRTGKIFMDHNMNARSKSLASVYSPRVAPEACVSTPLEWNELQTVYPTQFDTHTVPKRLAERGDLWKDILKHKNDLSSAFKT